MRKQLILTLVLGAMLCWFTARADGEQWVTFNVQPGELPVRLYDTYGSDVHSLEYLRVTGRADSLDLRNLARFRYLRKLDLGNLDVVGRGIPDRMCYQTDSLRSVVLPGSVNRIGRYAFGDCYKLESITFSSESQIEECDYYAFGGCQMLKELYVPNLKRLCGRVFIYCSKLDPSYLRGVELLTDWIDFRNCGISEVPEGFFAQIKTNTLVNAFAGCRELKKLWVPDGVTVINGMCEGCEKLEEVHLGNSVTTLRQNTFKGTAIKEIELPATVNWINSNSFMNCPNLTKITCKALLPPAMDRFSERNGYSGTTNLAGITLVVSKAAYQHYLASVTGWGQLKLGTPIDVAYDKIYVPEAKTLLLDPQYNECYAPGTEMEITYQSDFGGQLLVEGAGTLHLGKLKIDRAFGNRTDTNVGTYRDHVSLVNKSRYLTTDEVDYSQAVRPDMWNYVVIPFDVDQKEIGMSEGTHVVFKKYDGTERAAGRPHDVWKPVPATETLLAGQPYALYCTNLEDSWQKALTFHGDAKGNCNYVLKSDAATYPVTQCEAEFAFDRSWNNLGNPYMCYYDIRSLFDQDGNQVTAPMYIWDGSSFVAYSPVDDNRTLAPYEGFFMQAPATVESVTFIPEGRLLYDEAKSKGLRAPSVGRANRNVLNFNLLNADQQVNRTRIVISEDATVEYEPGRDAAKFFEGDAPKIFVSGNADYEICERPLGNGRATLGVSAKTAGEFTLHLDGTFPAGWKVTITDHLTGKSANLTDDDYTFTAREGNDNARFSVVLRALEDDDPSSWTVFNIENPGDIKIACDANPDLAKSILKLRVTGQMNWQDTDAIHTMTNLVKVDLSGALFPDNRLPRYLFKSFADLEQVALPDATEVIMPAAFEGCKKLVDVNIPTELYCLDNSAFSGCESLTSISLNEKLRYIGAWAFYNTPLTSIVLPETMCYIGTEAFNTRNTRTLTTIECHSLIPPVYDGAGWSEDRYYNILSYIQQVQVIVPEASFNAYHAHSGWNKHLAMRPQAMTFSKVVSEREAELEITPEVVSSFNNPSSLDLYGMYLYGEYPEYEWYQARGELTIEGSTPMAFDEMNIFMRHHYNHGTAYWENRPCVGSIINNNPGMSASNISLRALINQRYWHFFSLPFDIAFDEIEVAEGNFLAVRVYDGKARAEGDMENAWKKIEQGDIVEANQGFVIYVHPAGGGYALQSVRFRNHGAGNTTMFAVDPQRVALEENPSETESDRSWNFVGNPYPAYYDITALADENGNPVTTPITYRHTDHYEACSPLDDNLILYPFEPIFIQKPAKGEIVFTPTGRMHYTEALNSTEKPGLFMPEALNSVTGRNVFNFDVLSNGEQVNRARVVINEDALATYESTRDAAKFIEEDCRVPQLYVAGDCRYAICERPLGDATAMLGLVAPESGTYTLKLSGRHQAAWKVWITDMATGSKVNLADEDYLFAANGNEDARFMVSFDIADITGISAPAIEADRIIVTDIAGVKVYEGARSGFKTPAPGIYIISDGVNTRKVYVNK